MDKQKRLSSLLKLLDDDSAVVREAVLREFENWGDNIQEALAQLEKPPTMRQKKLIDQVQADIERNQIEAHWLDWRTFGSDTEQLESALTRLSAHQEGLPLNKVDLPQILDELAHEYKSYFKEANAYDLSQFLFKIKRIKGSKSGYDDPRLSDLQFVINKGKGIPISLASLYMLVGMRIGIHVEGCNLPGHFLSRVVIGGKIYLVDGFHSGKFIEQDKLLAKESSHAVHQIIRSKVSADMMVLRILHNLIKAYENTQNEAMRVRMLHLQEKTSQTREVLLFENTGSLFLPGQVVQHRRYGYRGVIVDFDLSCQANEKWYAANQTQPDKDQPWYHVLVDGSDQFTYAAESNLLETDNQEEVNHPLISYFFIRSKDRNYLRNTTPWPK